MKYKSILLVALLAFGITLAVVVGQRLSAEAMAVIIGVVAGVAASIPTSLIVVWIATRPAAGSRPGGAAAPETRAEDHNPPRVVVVQASPPAQPQITQPMYPYANPYPQPQNAFAPMYSAAPAYGGPTLPAPRTFTVIGGEVLEDFEAER